MEAKEQTAVETSHQGTADRKGKSLDLPKIKTKIGSGKRESGNLKKTIAALKKENAEFKEKHLRLAAEFENYRKMMTRELENRARNTKENLILEFLAVVDDFSRECLALEPDTSLSGIRVARELDVIIAQRGKPVTCVSDNGTELTSSYSQKLVTRVSGGAFG